MKRFTTIVPLVLFAVLLAATAFVHLRAYRELTGWLCMLTGLAFVAQLTVWIAASVLRDRHRTRQLQRRLDCRCVGCGFDRRGLASDNCPECGRHWALDDEEIRGTGV